MSSNSGDFAPRAMHSDSGYSTSTTSNSRGSSSKKSLSNLKYDRMTATMAEVASSSISNSNSNSSEIGGKSLGIERIKIMRKGSNGNDTIRGSVEGQKKRVRDYNTSIEEDEGGVVENVEEWWKKQEIQKEAKKRKRSRITNDIAGGPGASSGRLGEGFKLMNVARNAQDFSNYNEDIIMEDEVEESGFNLEVRKVASPSGSGRIKTMVLDKRSNDLSRRDDHSKFILPAWLQVQQPQYPKKEPSEVDPYEIRGFKSSSETSSSYNSPPTSVSTQGFKAPPFSTSGKTYSNSSSPHKISNPPKPFFEAQLNFHNQPREFSQPVPPNYPREDTFQPQLSSPSPIQYNAQFESSPILYPQNQPFTRSHSSQSFSNHSNFGLYKSTEDFLSDTTHWNQPIIPNSRALFTIEGSVDSESEILDRFWKNSPNINKNSIQIKRSNSDSARRDNYSTHLLRGANAYSLTSQPQFQSQQNFSTSTDYLDQFSTSDDLKPFIRQNSNSHIQSNPSSLRYSPHLHPIARKLSNQSNSGKSSENTVTPSQSQPQPQPNSQSRSMASNIVMNENEFESPNLLQEDYQEFEIFEDSENRINLPQLESEEEEELWNTIDGIYNCHTNPLQVEERIQVDENVVEVEGRKEKDQLEIDDQIFIEGLKFDWDEEEVEGEIGVENIVTSAIDQEVIESNSNQIEVEEEEEEENEENEAEVEKGDEDEGPSFHIWEDPEDPIASSSIE